MKKLFTPYLCGTNYGYLSFLSFPRKSSRSKNRGLALLFTWIIIFFVPCGFGAEIVLVEDDFSGLENTPPDALKFEWSGEVTQNGSGQLILNTWEVNTSWIRSITNAAPKSGETLVLQMRVYAYAEPAVYGDLQPRGLRVGNDANNAIEFYSIYGTTIGRG